MRFSLLGIFIGLWFISSVVAAQNVIRFATEASYPPFESIENDQFVGFDIDLARALCQQMNSHCVFSHQPFDSLLASIEFGRYDAAISAIDITPEREQQVMFTHSYLMNGAVFVAKSGRFNSYQQLHQRVIAVQNGSSEQQYLLDYFVSHGTIAIPYASYQLALSDLQGGKVDSVLVDQAVAADWLHRHPGFSVVDSEITSKDYFGRGFGIAVNKENQQLADRFNQALDAIKKNGIYQQIYSHYFADEKKVYEN
ncbi:transporter substrate-binding domain-containing protein [Celerinatantimonas sp. YJH-8]|uniref:transporter substrate-binding domain-containing protein n=1 Tax=Celerinatantimonas sp. YJH-8 TaxID=3228714 RepID=UPI0038C57CDD